MKQFARVYQQDVLVKQDHFEVFSVSDCPDELILNFTNELLFHLFPEKKDDDSLIYRVKYNYYNIFENYDSFVVEINPLSNVTYI